MKRIFISFAIEDSHLRDFLVGQAKNTNSPFEFVDMSVKEPWSNSWKTRCRTKIKGCDGVIAIVTKNSMMADGERWELECTSQEKIPCLGIWGNNNHLGVKIPPELPGYKMRDWTWLNISSWINNL
ncbi:hypothetical protein [Enterococcus faecalis]|uniref:hypothetical protein n=1 Tax=Enterococcus faecalis TaxID=1351 RepID=UPI0022F07FD1|nr:hypothetical protein [Enterococcus faecalis]MCV6045751.1 hypothetical protein [Enterococcus faecalis]